MNSRGRIIAIEGLDGVGKTTLCAALGDCVQLATPGPQLTAARTAVHAFAESDPVALQLFYAMSVRVAGRQALEHAQAGAHVVIDRYWLSTIAYALARGAPSSLPDVEALITPVDMTVNLVLDEAERLERLSCRGMTSADRETLVLGFRDDVARNLRIHGQRTVAGRFVEIDGTGKSVCDIAAEVLRLLG